MDLSADPGSRVDCEIKKHPDYDAYRRTPENLLDALRVFETSAFSKRSLGTDLVTAFVNLKKKEWVLYMAHLSKWELDFYSNC